MIVWSWVMTKIQKCLFLPPPLWKWNGLYDHFVLAWKGEKLFFLKLKKWSFFSKTIWSCTSAVQKYILCNKKVIQSIRFPKSGVCCYSTDSVTFQISSISLSVPLFRASETDGKNGGPKVRNCNLRETRSGIWTTKMKKKFWRPALSTKKSDTFFTAEFNHFFIVNCFSRKCSPKIFSIFLH
jgi:hypothetical protein